LGTHQYTLVSHLKTRFKQKFRQNVPKNAYFLKRSYKIAAALPPRIPIDFRQLGAPFPDPACSYRFFECVSSDSLAESDQKTLKVGIHSFPAWRSAF